MMLCTKQWDLTVRDEMFVYNIWSPENSPMLVGRAHYKTLINLHYDAGNIMQLSLIATSHI